MMNKYITFVSWEDRFVESLKHDLNELSNIDEIVCFYFEEEKFYSKTKKNISELQEIVNNESITISIYSLSFDDYLFSWKTMNDVFSKFNTEDEFILNISTMPRNIIFSIYHFLTNLESIFSIKYFSPMSHGNDITRNPSKPELILQHGGIMLPSKKIILIVILGHDIKRVHQLYNFIEPSQIHIGLGTNHQTALPSDLDTDFDDIQNKEIFEINSFSNEKVYSILKEKILTFRDDFNIVLCSLGPKIETVGMFKVHREYPETALLYAPSKDYADDYSLGTNLSNIITINSM